MVEAANEVRLAAYYNVEDWPDKLARFIKLSVAVGDPYFRWFSSGDLQSAQMLLDIFTVCRLTPEIQHWLPTQERYMVNDALKIEKQPGNLTIRISAPVINGVTPVAPNSSAVLGPMSSVGWRKRVASNTQTRYHCPASLRDTYECGDCRACWDASIKTICYKLR
jgi:hypothetical protein